jgi:hypothetical protein
MLEVYKSHKARTGAGTIGNMWRATFSRKTACHVSLGVSLQGTVVQISTMRDPHKLAIGGYLSRLVYAELGLSVHLHSTYQK